ncbi:hypothetical protein BDV93DRAFT_401099, partial [Ceratobasidium sp. AG-I]
IGEGTVVLYCWRVIQAIHKQGLVSVVWMMEEQRRVIKCGFQRICGLETKPQANGDNYISRKQTLLVNVQAIVNHEGLFPAFQSGWAGSQPD